MSIAYRSTLRPFEEHLRMVCNLYLPPGVWRQIGWALLDADDWRGMYDLCLACKAIHRALEPEFADLFGPPILHSAFRSRYLREKVCLPFESTLRNLLTEMRTSPRRTSLLVGGIGDVEGTVMRLLGPENHATDVVPGDNRVRCTIVVQMQRDREAFKKLSRVRHSAAQKGLLNDKPALFVFLGLTKEEWRTSEYLHVWSVNHTCYKASVVYVNTDSESELVAPPIVLHNTDGSLHISCTRVSYQALSGRLMPESSAPAGPQ